MTITISDYQAQMMGNEWYLVTHLRWSSYFPWWWYLFPQLCLGDYGYGQR